MAINGSNPKRCSKTCPHCNSANLGGPNSRWKRKLNERKRLLTMKEDTGDRIAGRDKE